MTKLSDNARFNRDSLLGAWHDGTNDPMLKDAMAMEYPGENYLLASYAVWVAMKNTAIRDGAEKMDGDGNRPGYVLKNVRYADIIILLWSTLPKSFISRTRIAISKYLRISGNILSLAGKQTFGRDAEWWIAEEWTAFDKKPRRTQRPDEDSRRQGRPLGRTVPADSQPVLTAVPENDWDTNNLEAQAEHDVSVQPLKEEWTGELHEAVGNALSELESRIGEVMRENARLTAENKKYREDLDTVRRAMRIIEQ